MKSKLCVFAFLLLIISYGNMNVLAQSESPRVKIENIIDSAKGRVGAAIMGIENGDTLTFNNKDHYPMQSVYKFPLALMVLSKVDAGKLSLDQKIHITKKDLHPNTWSPMLKKYNKNEFDISLRELLRYTVSESDNNGCDILFRLVGGPKKVNQYIHGLGIKEMQIAATEEEMHKEWNIQYTNWSTPEAMAKLFYKFMNDSLLSKTNNRFLWNSLVSNIYGAERIKGLLPKGTVVAHKTGSSDTNDKGITAASNDAGIVTLPNGKHFAIVVFVSDSPDDAKTRDLIIARIAKVAWDYYSKN